MMPIADRETNMMTLNDFSIGGIPPISIGAAKIGDQPIEYVDESLIASIDHKTWYGSVGSLDLTANLQRAPRFASRAPAQTEFVDENEGFPVFEALRSLLGRSATLAVKLIGSDLPASAFRQLFSTAKNEVFEDGMESNFSRMLAILIEEHKGQAIKFAEEYLDSDDCDEEVAAETLRQLGHSDHKPTYNSRLNLLVRGLKHDSSMVRDGAILGLASMDDPSVIPDVEKAVKREKDPELHDDMDDVLEQLRATLTEA